MTKTTVRVDLALQGGGSHGAFTWGVLDRLLEEEWLDIEGVSGTSAGAMNSAVLADGFAADGREGARRALDRYWRRVADAALFSPFKRTPLDRLLGRWSLDTSPGYLAMDLMSRMFSPYQFNPMGGNALAPILKEAIDFERLRGSPIKLFVTATNVRTGRPRVFRNAEITPEVLLASACLPTLFQAIEIDGERYWDGGYSGNPTLLPLVQELESDDTILVPINPLERPGTPTNSAEILNRLNEVSFNAVAVKELYMMALLQRHASALPPGSEADKWARMRVHVVRNTVLSGLGASSKLNAELDFLTMLKEEGRKAAATFLAEHGEDVGTASSASLDELLAEL